MRILPGNVLVHDEFAVCVPRARVGRRLPPNDLSVQGAVPVRVGIVSHATWRFEERCAIWMGIDRHIVSGKLVCIQYMVPVTVC